MGAFRPTANYLEQLSKELENNVDHTISIGQIGRWNEGPNQKFSARERRDRRQQVQGGELARQQLHEREDGPPPGADRGERCALSEPTRHTADRQTSAGEEPSEVLRLGNMRA